MQIQGFSVTAIQHWHDNRLAVLHERGMRAQAGIEYPMHRVAVVRGFFAYLPDLVLTCHIVVV